MLRYGRLYLAFLRFAFSRAMEFRVDFFFRIIMDVVFYVVSLGFFTIIYQHTALLGGWDLDQIYVFVAVFLCVDAIYMTLFSTGCWYLPFRINNGELDYYLLRPVSSLFFLTSREFAANSFLNLLIAVGILVWAVINYGGAYSLPALFFFLVQVLLGSLTALCLMLLFLIPTFWTQSFQGLRDVANHIFDFAERPVQIYPAWMQRTFLSILPVALISSWPCVILFNGISPERLAVGLLVPAALFLAVVFFWSRGLRAYSTASS